MNAGDWKEAVRRELDAVLASPGFSRNDRQSEFLRFLVDRHLEGRDAELKESVIGVEVFGRDPGYDPKIDGIVRTEAKRLRTRLERYYAAEGSRDPLIIELPKGAYRPVVRERAPEGSQPRAFSRRMAWIGVTIAALAVAGVAVLWSTRASTARLTVAVLPFENQANNPDSDYFADGLTDEIIRNLSVIDGLTVPSRTSSFALKGKLLNAVESGRRLGADYIIEGSVLHAGNRLRVIVSLVRVSDEARLWSERFDRELTDVVAIQDEISRGVVNTLRLRLNPGRRRYETNIEAYDLYLRGRHTMSSFPAPARGRPVGKMAVQYFEQAIAKDANYAIAYAGLADALLAIDENIMAPDAYARARAAAERAVELDPLLSEAQSAAAAIRAREYDWAGAARGFRRAIELNPNNALARLKLGASVLVVEGRFDDGLREVHRAVELDPFSPYVATEFGRALVLAGRYGEAVEQFRKAIALDPSRTRPYNLMGRALYLQGKSAEALTVFDESVKRGAPEDATEWLVCAEVRAGHRAEAVALLEDHLRSGRPARRLAEAYACLGDEEHALDYLEKALAERQPGLAEILQSPEWAAIRSSPRSAVLRKKMNLIP